ncbi:MAG TPA: sugar transferase [Candidatus Sulfotelmatobacter sp.]|nr:sugar transferase [Candidatus Sulfotelmatobacter sp.]
MASIYINSRQQKTATEDWARLIPGEKPVPAPEGRKPVGSVRRIVLERVSQSAAGVVASEPERAISLLWPAPLRSRMARRWLYSMAADFALVALNWLFIGAAQVPLRGIFPQARLLEYAAGSPRSLLGIALLHASLITLMGYTEGLHRASSHRGGQARILGKSVFWATTLLCFAYGLQGAPWTISGLFCGAGLLHFGTLWSWRRQRARQDRRSLASGHARNVLIVGAGSVGQRVAADVKRHPEGGRVVCGFLDNERPLSGTVIGRVNDLARVARTGFVDEIILAAPHDRILTSQVLRESRRLRLDVEIVPDLFGCAPAEREIERVGDLPVICLHAEQLPAASLVLKRLVDVVGAGIALATLAPLLAGIAALIKLDSRGAIFYCAPRAGRKGRLFRCCKFRTMVSNADALKDQLRKNNKRSGPFFKMADDPRITGLGRWLRRYSLDELPQLWNVLKGDMSLVGPRPHPIDEFAAYEIEYLGRLDMTPGMTGLWQVSARRDPSCQRGIELDRSYIQTWSLRSDFRILLRTFLEVARGSGE